MVRARRHARRYRGSVTVMLFAAVLGVVAGFVAGGSVRHLGSRRLRGTGLTLLWAAMVLATTRDRIPGAHGVYLASFGVALLVVLINVRAMPALFVVGVGLVCNLTVIAVNGGMPYTGAALRASGIPRPERSVVTATPQRHLQTETDRLYWLMDHIPVAAGPIREVLSPGDILVAVGLGLTCCTALLPGRRRRAPAPLVPVGHSLDAHGRSPGQDVTDRVDTPSRRHGSHAHTPGTPAPRSAHARPARHPRSRADGAARASAPLAPRTDGDLDPDGAGDLFWAERARLRRPGARPNQPADPAG